MKEMENKVEHYFTVVQQWFTANSLKINPTKTKTEKYIAEIGPDWTPIYWMHELNCYNQAKIGQT